MSVSTTAFNRKTQQKVAPERHVLVIDDGHRRAISLDAAAYSIGRDQSNAIVLSSSTVSRKHSILLRLPIPGENRYRYRVIDGDSTGKPSANGVFVNRQRCSSHELVNGDTLSFGRKIQASYLTVTMDDAEFSQYLESIEFHSLKSNLVNCKATLVADTEFASERPLVSLSEESRSEPDFKGTVIEPIDSSLSTEDTTSLSSLQALFVRHRIGIIVASVLVVSGLGVWVAIAANQSQAQKTTVPTQTVTQSA